MMVNFTPGELSQINIRIDDLKGYVGDQIEGLRSDFTGLDDKVDTLNDTMIRFMATQDHEEKQTKKKHDFRLVASGAVSALAMVCSVVVPVLVK